MPTLTPARARSAVAWITLFCVLAAHALLETARDALFLTALPVSELPWVVGAIAALAVLVARLETVRPVARRLGRSLRPWLLASTGVTFLFWLSLERVGPWGVIGLYVWTGLSTTLVLARFWSSLAGHVTLTQAKGLYAMLGTGTVGGAIAGHGLAVWLTSVTDTRHLLLAAAGALGMASLLTMVPASGEARAKAAGSEPALGLSLLRSLRRIRSSAYATRVALLVMLGTATFTVADYLLKSEVAAHVAPAQMGQFFGELHLGVSVAALVVQAALVRVMLRRFGMSMALGALPALLMMGATLIAVGGGLAAAVLLFATQGALRHSLHQTTIELLYVPMRAHIRATAKTVVEVVARRGGQMLGSLLIVLIPLNTLGVEWLAAGLVVVAASWLALALSLRPLYLDVFRSTLRAGVKDHDVQFPELDIASLETLMASLNSPDDAKVLAALDILAEEGRCALVPSLLVYHPSERVVLRVAELLSGAGRDDLAPIADRLLDKAPPAVASALVAARTAVRPDRAWLRAQCAKERPAAVRTAAAIELVSRGWADEKEASAVLGQALRASSSAARAALATAIGRGSLPGFEAPLLRLLDDSSHEVRSAACRALGSRASEHAMRALVERLPERNTRTDVRTAIVAAGERALPQLARFLDDAEIPNAAREVLPSVIAQLGSPSAAQVLLRQLAVERSSRVRRRIVVELQRMRAMDAYLSLDAEALRQSLDRALARAYRLLSWRWSLEGAARETPGAQTPVHALLLRLLHDKEKAAIDLVLRVLALMHPQREIERVRLGLQSSNADVWSSSYELLEALLPPSRRNAVLSLVESGDDRLRLEGGRDVHRMQSGTYRETLQWMMDSDSWTLRHVAAEQGRLLAQGAEETELRAQEQSEPPTTPFGEWHATAALQLGEVRA